MRITTQSRIVRSAFAMEAVRAVKGGEPTPFHSVLRDLESLAKANRIDVAIVGGLAAIRHGDERETQDVDILIGTGDAERLLKAAPQYGFNVRWVSKSGWHNLEHRHTGIEVNVVPEGGRARDDAPTTIPGPRGVGVHGFGYANLKGWIELKLSSDRVKDRGHVVEVLKKASPAQIRSVRKHLSITHPILLERFELLRNQAQAEKKQERKRGGRR